MKFFSRGEVKLPGRWLAPAALVVALPSCGPSGNSGSPAPPLGEQLARGAQVYEISCAQCHYDGSGNSAAPDLKGSPVFRESPEALAQIILKGRSGISVVNGRKFNGVMPAQAYLTDEEIAAVVAYTRDVFGASKAVVPPAEVGAWRAR